MLYIYTRKTRTRFGHMHARLDVCNSRASMQLCTQRKLEGRNNCIIAGPAVAYTWSNVYHRNTLCVRAHTRKRRFLSLYLPIIYLFVYLCIHLSIYTYIYIHVRVHTL